MKLRSQLGLLSLVSVAAVALALLVALRSITYRAFSEQQRASLSGEPFDQARQVRLRDLAHLGRLMASDATLVTAWRTVAREIAAYSEADPSQTDRLNTLRQACLPSLWDISQRLFLESDPSSSDPSPHTQTYQACADLLLFTDQRGTVVVEQRTNQHREVTVRFPLDPSQEPLPHRISLAQDPLFQNLNNRPVSAYWFYDKLYQVVAVPSPFGAVILGDRVDHAMMLEASRLTGYADTVVWAQDSVLASSSELPIQQLPENGEIELKNKTFLSAKYPLKGVDGAPVGWMLFLKATADLDAVAQQQAWVAAVLVALAALLGVAAGAPLADHLARPLLSLSQAMARVGQGDLEAQAPLGGPQEVVAAAQAFNTMVEGLRQKETLEKFVSKLEQLRKSADPQDPLVRDQIQFGSYVVARRLGLGGMATVYAALPADTLEEAGQVAIKVIQPAFAQDPEYQARFQREFKIMQRLDHPGLVRVLESGQLHGLLYIAMEYVEGENLRQLLEREGCLEMPRFLQLALPVLEAVEAAHQAGVIHRDLKPDNVMITKDGIKVMDFGLASAAGISRLTQAGDTVGTPLYMAPEQVRANPCGAQSDQYSLGIMFFEMLTGITPFQGDNSMGLILQHITDPPPRPRDVCSDIPEHVESAILKMLAKDPAERYADLMEVKLALVPR